MLINNYFVSWSETLFSNWSTTLLLNLSLSAKILRINVEPTNPITIATTQQTPGEVLNVAHNAIPNEIEINVYKKSCKYQTNFFKSFLGFNQSFKSVTKNVKSPIQYKGNDDNAKKVFNSSMF